MGTSSQSVRNRQRTRVFDAYRGRGRKNNNLWLVYSVKMDRDWILPSDRQLIHWLYYLEIQPVVKSFDLVPPPIISHNDFEVRETELDAVVVNRDGSKEWHEVKSSEIEKTAARSQLLAQSAGAAEVATKYVVFTDADLAPYAGICMRWLKAICYAAVLRGQEQIPTLIALTNVVQDLTSGTIGEIESVLPGFDSIVIRGLIVRMAIEGTLSIDLKSGSFRAATPWRLIEGAA